MNDVTVVVEHISKSYKLYEKPVDRLKESLSPFRKKYHRDFFALRDVSFSVRRGETFGILGRNGAGKSTLLKILSGIMTPTGGKVSAQGKIAALLELGAGFNPEMSGLDNVYIYGAIAGYSKQEMDKRIQGILEFADIGEFIDQPMKNYSSGMFIRLVFSAAISIEPDVLIVDEALAVGDVKFQAKCFRRFAELIARGTTIILVTHSTEQVVRHCDRAMLIEAGEVLFIGEPKAAVNRYMDLLFGCNSGETAEGEAGAPAEQKVAKAASLIQADRFENRRGYNTYEYRWGSRSAEIFDCFVTTDGENYNNEVNSGTEVTVIVWVRHLQSVEFPIYGLTIKTPDGVEVYGSNSRDFSAGPLLKPANEGGVATVTFRFTALLAAGEYFISLGVAAENAGTVVPLDRRYDSVILKVNATERFFGLANLRMDVEIR